MTTPANPVMVSIKEDDLKRWHTLLYKANNPQIEFNFDHAKMLRDAYEFRGKAIEEVMQDIESNIPF